MQISINKKDLLCLVELAEMFCDVAMSSYYSSDIHLQESTKELNELVTKIKKGDMNVS